MGWDWGGVGSGAMSGAGTGAMFGPWGAAAGGVAGGLLGGLKGGDKKDAPPQEDFYGAGTSSTQGPMGGQQWSKGADGKWQSSLGFSGQAGNTFGALQNGMQRAANYDPAQARQDAINSNYNQATSRLDPMWAQRGQAFQSGMANQGLDPGGEAYNAAYGNESRAMNDAYSTAMAGAVQQGNETQDTQMRQMNQPFNQAGAMMQMLQQGQGNNLNAPLVAAGMTQKANDAAADRAAASSGGKKGGAGSLLGGAGSMMGGSGGKKSGGRTGMTQDMGDYGDYGDLGRGYGAGD